MFDIYIQWANNSPMHYIIHDAPNGGYIKRIVRYPYTVVTTPDVEQAKHFSSHGRANRFRRSHGSEQATVEPSPIFTVGAQIVYGNHQLRDVTGYYRNSLGDYMLRTRYFNGEVAADVAFSEVRILERD